MNLVEAVVDADSVTFATHRLPLPERLRGRVPPGRLVLGLRPSDLVLAGPSVDPSLPRLRVEPTVIERLGDQCHVLFAVDAPSYTSGQEHRALDPDMDDTQILAGDERAIFTAVLNGRVEASIGEPLELALNHENMHLFDRHSGEHLSGAAPGSGAPVASGER